MKRLENELGDRAIVISVDIHSEVGRAIGDRYNARAVPAFILFNSAGEIVWRGSTSPSVETVLGNQ